MSCKSTDWQMDINGKYDGKKIHLNQKKHRHLRKNFSFE